MVRFVHEVARYTKISVIFLYPANCDIQQTFGPRGAGYRRFYCARVPSGGLSQMFKMNMKRDVTEIDFENVSD
jgi:hypothetical protein